MANLMRCETVCQKSADTAARLSGRLAGMMRRSCRLFSPTKTRNTSHDRTAAFPPPLLRGLGYLPTASCRGHRAPYQRAAYLAQHAATLVAWHVRDAYCRQSRLVVPRPDGDNMRRVHAKRPVLRRVAQGKLLSGK